MTTNINRNCFFAIALVALSFVSCKTSEANYKAAYEQAVQAREQGDRETVYDHKRTPDATNAVEVAQGIELPQAAMRVKMIPVANEASADAYYLVVAGFKQQFNANSLATRLGQEGYATALLQTAEPYFYVSVQSAGDQAGLASALEEIRENTWMPFKNGYPFVLKSVK